MRRILSAFFISLAMPGAVLAATRPKRLEIWDLPLGAAVSELPDEFVDYACGTGGGAPSLPLKNFADFRRCRAEANGWREVYFRYDDELEYWARANSLTAEMEQYAGTKTYGFPIVASLLIDSGGVVRGMRIVSDPRYDTQREEAYFLKNFLMSRLGREGWRCEDLPPDEGETSVDGVFVKQRCTTSLADGRGASLLARHLRKSGQTRFDPRSGKQTTNLFESSVRFEMSLTP